MNNMISVVIIAFNVERYIKQCMESVINQTYNNIEIIVVDDGSTDHTLEFIKLVANKYTDKKIRIIEQSNNGPGSARNTGIRYSNGNYLFFLDGDDYIRPKTIENFCKIVTSVGEMDFIQGRMRYVNETDDIICDDSVYLDTDIILNGQEAYLNSINKYGLIRMGVRGLYNKGFLNKNKLYFGNFLCGEDTEWCYRVFMLADRVVGTDKADYCYRVSREGSLTTRVSIQKAKDEISALYSIKQMISNNYDIGLALKGIVDIDLCKRCLGIFYNYSKSLKKESLYELSEEFDSALNILQGWNKTSLKYHVFYKMICILGTHRISKIINYIKRVAV